jgi:hypothetical protein
MSSASFGVWNSFSLLHDAVQFPWRLNIIFCIAALPLAAFMLSDLTQRVQFRFGYFAIVILFAATWVVGYGASLKGYTLPPYTNETFGEAHDWIDDDWLSGWTSPGTNVTSAFPASKGPQSRFLSGQGSARVLRWAPRDIEVQTDCAACGPLVVKQFYYPEWKARLAPSGQVLPICAELPQGLLQVQVPPGSNRIQLEIPDGLAERMGNWVSVLGAMLCAGLCVVSFLRGRQERRERAEPGLQ